MCLAYVYVFMSYPFPSILVVGAVAVCMLVCVYINYLSVLDKIKKITMIQEINSLLLHLQYVNLCAIALFLQQQDS